MTTRPPHAEGRHPSRRDPAGPGAATPGSDQARLVVGDGTDGRAPRRGAPGRPVGRAVPGAGGGGPADRRPHRARGHRAGPGPGPGGPGRVPLRRHRSRPVPRGGGELRGPTPRRRPRTPRPAQRTREFFAGAVGAYIHRLPVDQEFSCAAGRDIWGFPKWVTTIDIDEPDRSAAGPARAGTGTTVRLVDDGVHVLTLTVAGRRSAPAAVPTPSELLLPRRRAPPHPVDDVGRGRRPAGSGGATLVLGDHPMADELRSLGLPKRALFSSSTALMTASFGGAEVVTPDRAGRPPARPGLD